MANKGMAFHVLIKFVYLLLTQESHYCQKWREGRKPDSRH
jgi:hypothetical protein